MIFGKAAVTKSWETVRKGPGRIVYQEDRISGRTIRKKFRQNCADEVTGGLSG